MLHQVEVLRSVDAKVEEATDDRLPPFPTCSNSTRVLPPRRCDQQHALALARPLVLRQLVEDEELCRGRIRDPRRQRGPLDARLLQLETSILRIVWAISTKSLQVVADFCSSG